MSAGRATLLTGLCALLACSKGYLSVTVTGSTPALASSVVQILVTATDSRADGGPVLLPEDAPLPSGLSGLPDASLVFTVEAPPGSSVTIFVQGIGVDGGVVAANGATVSSVTSSSHLALPLFESCATDHDCKNPQAVCQGTISCNAQSFCGPVTGTPAFLDAGSACGPCSGTCDGNGTCLLADCGCLITFTDGGVGYGFDPTTGEQCDDGNGPDGGNSDTLPDHCRTNCRFASCGDGVLDPDAGEICDFDAGNNGRGLGCNATCNLFGLVSTVAGGPDGGLQDGIGDSALFYLPYGVAVLDGLVYVADTYFRALRQVDPSTGQVTTIAGGNTSCVDANGQGAAGTFCDINGVAAYAGNIIATDDSCLRLVTPGGAVSTFAGQLALNGTPATGVDAGPFATALYGVPQGIAVLNGEVYTDSKLDGFVLQSDPAQQEMTVIDIIGASSALQLGGVTAFDNQIYVSNKNITGSIFVLDGGSGDFTTLNLNNAALNAPDGLCNDGRSIYICETGTNEIKQFDTDAGTLSLLAGGAGALERDGLGADAGFHSPAACAYDPARKRLYVTDKFGYTVRVIQ